MSETTYYPTLTEKKYQRLKRMVHGTDSDRQLIVRILDQCNIKDSFLYVLALMSQSVQEKKTLGTFLIDSKRFSGYLLFHYKHNEIPTMYDLDWVLKTWDIHCNEFNLPVTKEDRKFLTSEYVPHNRGASRSLNPKKRR